MNYTEIAAHSEAARNISNLITNLSEAKLASWSELSVALEQVRRADVALPESFEDELFELARAKINQALQGKLQEHTEAIAELAATH